MSRKQGMLLGTAVLLMIALLFFIVFSERGLAELSLSKKERDRIKALNQHLTQENLTLGVEIDRLKNDPHYIESVARKEYGMIGQNEIVVKPQRASDR
ncbi:MAG TPA: septum formation initiator family protein [Desulfobacterales bacterium]|nr:septum formation initiator family protein [Desulfobacterales bacterium]